MERPEQNTVTNKPFPVCSIQTAPFPEEKGRAGKVTVLFQIKDPRHQNFTLKSRVMDVLQKSLKAAQQNAAFPGRKPPELRISRLVGQGRQHLQAG